MKLRTYYLLTKPGIIFGNVLTTTGGFALASRGHFDLWLFLATFAGIGLVIASACVCNNYIDRHTDQKMVRTQNRPLAKGLISGQRALLFASFLASLGIALLTLFTNPLTVFLALLGFFIYVGLYSFWKTRTSYATLVGSISGALPPVIGYTAVTSHLDTGALLLFAILVLWQMPHFFSIALYRFDDYVAAAIPVLPAVKGAVATKIQMLLYIAAFLLSLFLLLSWGYVGSLSLLATAPLGLAWLYLSIRGFSAEDDRLWARRMFRLSLLIIVAFCFAISFDPI